MVGSFRETLGGQILEIELVGAEWRGTKVAIFPMLHDFRVIFFIIRLCN